MHTKLFLGAFIALVMTAAQASANYYNPPPRDCTNGGNECTSVPVELYMDNFNRSYSSTISTNGNTWYGHEDSSYFNHDISIYNNLQSYSREYAPGEIAEIMNAPVNAEAGP